MPIDVQAELIRQVESASLGAMTVRFTSKGQPSYFYRLRKFNVEDIDPSLGSGVHPAFVVGGVTKDEILIGTQAAVEIDGEGISMTGHAPRVTINHDAAVDLMRQTGPGFCVATNAMYAALALLIWRDQQYPRGNTNYGRSHSNTDEYGLRPDGNPAIGGNVNGNQVVRTGTGPVTWNWPRNVFGIQGLTGNVWEWAPGMRNVDGEINIIAGNDMVLPATDHSAASAAWKAIDYTDGSLIAPGSANAVKYASSGTANGTIVAGSSGNPFRDLVAHGLAPAAEQLLKQLGLMPVNGPAGMLPDRFEYNLSGERLPRRGGSRSNGAGAGPFAVHLSDERSSASTSVGFRPAFVI